MKKLLYFLPFFCTYFSFSQILVKSDSTVFRKCNTIEISSNLSNDELYKICGNTIVENGLIIENAIKDFYTINTKPIETQSLRFISINIVVNNQKVKIKGFFVLQESNFVIRTKYPNGAFEYLQSLSIKINEKVKGKITYMQESNFPSEEL